MKMTKHKFCLNYNICDVIIISSVYLLPWLALVSMLSHNSLLHVLIIKLFWHSLSMSFC